MGPSGWSCVDEPHAPSRPAPQSKASALTAPRFRAFEAPLFCFIDMRLEQCSIHAMLSRARSPQECLGPADRRKANQDIAVRHACHDTLMLCPGRAAKVAGRCGARVPSELLAIAKRPPPAKFARRSSQPAPGMLREVAPEHEESTNKALRRTRPRPKTVRTTKGGKHVLDSLSRAAPGFAAESVMRGRPTHGWAALGGAGYALSPGASWPLRATYSR